ncbi:MAG: GNAT family N-acetyltransferase [Xanthomonadales bacterium]|nr:GNAT family N-acetyltransferase [Xanthomonadales bacterium]
MSLPAIELHTERLLLRPTQLVDFERWAELHADADAARHIGGVQPRSVVWRAFMGMAGAWALTGVAMFSVIHKRSGRWIGRIGPWQPEGWPGTEVGWALHPDAWGQGFASEAAVAAMDYAFDTLGWTEVIHSIDPANAPSQRLAERLGSRRCESVNMPAPYQDVVCDIWRQSRAEWQTRVRA